jgi:hypothetical protein
MTLGEFREKTKDLPAELIMISDEEGYGLCELTDAKKMDGYACTDWDGKTYYLDHNPQDIGVSNPQYYSIPLLFLETNL